MKLLEINPTKITLCIKYQEDNGEIHSYKEIVKKSDSGEWCLTGCEENKYYVCELKAILDILEKLNNGEIKKMFNSTIHVDATNN